MIMILLLFSSGVFLSMYMYTSEVIYCIITSLMLVLSWISVAMEKVSYVEDDDIMYGKSPDYLPYIRREPHEDFQMAVLNDINDV